MMKVNKAHKGIWYFFSRIEYERRIFASYLLYYVHFMFKEPCIAVLILLYFHILRLKDRNRGHNIISQVALM